MATLSKYLTFRAARQDFATDASCVRAILPASALLPLEGVRPGLLGIATTLDRTVAVFDLPVKLQLAGTCQGSPLQILVVDVIAGGKSHWAAFVVDRVADVLTYRDRDVHHGRLHGQGRTRKLVDFAQLVSESELTALWTVTP